MKVIFLPEARREQRDAWNWYRAESRQAASRFLEELAITLKRIAAAPQQFPLISSHQQRALLSRFPYSIVFEQTAEAILVVSVAHTSRRPGYWQDR